jgi:hypothetical protein
LSALDAAASLFGATMPEPSTAGCSWTEEEEALAHDVVRACPGALHHLPVELLLGFVRTYPDGTPSERRQTTVDDGDTTSHHPWAPYLRSLTGLAPRSWCWQVDYVRAALAWRTSLPYDVNCVLRSPPQRRALFEGLYAAGPVGTDKAGRAVVTLLTTPWDPTRSCPPLLTTHATSPALPPHHPVLPTMIGAREARRD